MYYYKNGRLKKVKGGYIVSCDKYTAADDAYDGMRYMQNKEEVFEDGEEAMEKLNEIYDIEMAMGDMMAKHDKIKSKKKNSESSDKY